MEDDNFDPNEAVVVRPQAAVVKGTVLGTVVSQPATVMGTVVRQQDVQPTVVQGSFVPQPTGAGDQTPLMSKSDYPMQPFYPYRNWKDGLCNCFSECSNCCCTCCCPFGPIAQLYERVVQRGSYWIIFIVLAFFFLMSILFEIIQPFSGGDSENISTAGDIFYWIFWLATFVLTCIVRKNVRIKYEIPEHCCPGLEDCCCAFWCTPCTMCQIWRHITGGSAGGARGCGCSEDPEKGCC